MMDHLDPVVKPPCFPCVFWRVDLTNHPIYDGPPTTMKDEGLIIMTNTDIFSADFDDGFDATVSTAPDKREAFVVKARFVEPCPSCHGSGRFISFRGRDVGPCFKCKGKGELVFRQHKSVRVAAKAKREERKIRDREENIEAFKTAHPDVWAWMDGSTFEFAVSLRQGIEKFGSLTDKQLAAAEKCAAKLAGFKAADAERENNAVEVDLTKINEAFANAKASGLKWPKVRFAGLTISLAGDRSRFPGSLQVKADGVWIGRIVEGKFSRGRDCTDDLAQRVVETCSDPKAAATAHGVETGSCSCCGRELTNTVSVELGIGPICAKKFGW